MTFATPFWLYAIPVALAVLGLLFWRTERKRKHLLETLAAPTLQPNLTGSASDWRRFTRYGLIALGTIALLLALARPQWGYDLRDVRGRGVDLLFALDVSRSMLAEDVVPNRLERSKLAILDLLDSLEGGERTGLVAFAGSAFLQAPLTLDRDAFRMALQELEPGILPRGGTDIAAAIAEAQAAYPDSDDQKLLILVTDGEDLAGEGLDQAREAAKHGLTIYTVGVGSTEGELIPVRENGRRTFLRDADGNIVKTSLDEASLRAIAEATGGFYARMEGVNPLVSVYQAGRALLPQSEREEGVRRIPIERFLWPLGFGLLCFLLEPLVGTRKMLPNSVTKLIHQKAALWLLAGGLLGLATADLDANPREGVKLYREGDFGSARERFQNASEEEQTDARITYNLGNTLYQLGELEDAADAFSDALQTRDLALQSEAFFNLGNTRFRLGSQQLGQQDFQGALESWQEAEQAFENALSLDPENPDIESNLAHVRDRIEKLEEYIKQLPPQEQEQQQGGENHEQEEQEQNEQEQNQQNQDGEQQEQNQSNQDQQGRDQDQRQDPQQQEPESGNEEEEEQEQESSPSDEAEQEQEAQQQEAQAREGQMSRQEAERLLEGLRTQERKLPAGELFRTERGESEPQPTKDW